MKPQNIIIFTWFILTCISGYSQISQPLPTDPGRLINIQKDSGFVVARSDSSMIRGICLSVWEAYVKNNYDVAKNNWDSSLYKSMQATGVNAIRLQCLDPYFNSENVGIDFPLCDFSDSADFSFLSNYMDSIVDMASTYDMNVVINYHDVARFRGAYRDHDALTIQYLKDFWTAVASRYKNRTHVSFELLNEPAGYYPGQWTTITMDSMKFVYDMVRAIAPDAHIHLFGFANLSASWDPTTIYNVIKSFESRHPSAIDWTKSSVSFHPYGLVTVSDILVQTMAEFPIMCSEASYPQWITNSVYQGLDGEEFIVQTMERLGIGWLHHLTEGDNYYIHWPLLLKDANDKGYLWFTPYEPVLQEPFHGIASEINDTIEAEDFDKGLLNDAYYDSISGSGGGGYRVTRADITQCIEGGYKLDLMKSGEWVEYTLNIPETGLYSVILRVASSDENGFLNVTSDSSESTTGNMKVPYTGGPQSWLNLADTISLKSGVQTIKIAVKSGAVSINHFRLVAGHSSEYQLEITATTGGIVDPSGTDAIKAFNEVIITATKEPGYIFSGWSGDVPAGMETENPLILTMNSDKSITANFELAPPSPNQAVFLKSDASTQGNWKGVYGEDGYEIVAESKSYPSYANVSYTDDFEWTWENNSSKPAALEKGASSGRIAACKSSYSSFSIDISFNDDEYRKVALYFYDFEPFGRINGITVKDGLDSTILDSREAASFGNGVYYTWEVKGHIIITISNLGNANCVISGLFFDSYPPEMFTLTTSANEGGIVSPSGSNEYDESTSVEVRANPNTGYSFLNWTGDVPAGHETQNPIIISMDSAISLTANFLINSYSISLSAGNGGEGVSIDPVQETYTHGQQVTITPIDSTGYDFSHWSGDVPSGMEQDNPLILTVESDLNITANFSFVETIPLRKTQGIAVYPNPVNRNEFITIDAGSRTNSKVKVRISDITGAILLQESYPESRQRIPVSRLNGKGIYFITISTNNGKETFRLIVE